MAPDHPGICQGLCSFKQVWLNNMEYLKITDEKFNYVISDKGQGIYKIYSLDNSDKPIPINRVLATDNSGILYIGTTPKRTLQERLSDFRQCVLPQYKGSAHTAGRRYCKIPAFMERFPYTTLAITLKP